MTKQCSLMTLTPFGLGLGEPPSPREALEHGVTRYFQGMAGDTFTSLEIMQNGPL